MERFQLAELARELPGEVWATVKELRNNLQEIRIFSRKVTGIGGWAVLAILLAVVVGTLLTHITEGLVPELLTIEAYPHKVSMLFLVWFISCGTLFYGTGYAIGKARFGGKLEHAQAKLETMYYASWSDRDAFLRALLFLNVCEPELMEFVSKKIMADFKAHLASLTVSQESA